MANTYLSDLGFVPETFKLYVDGEVLKKSDFLGSAAVVDAQIDLAPQFGKTVTLPAYDPLSGADEVHSATAPTINALTTSEQVAPILNRRKVYGSNDLVSYFTGVDPFRNAGNKFAEYWANRMDITLVASALGAAAGIDAVSAGSVINDISGGAGAAAVISASALIDTQTLMGEWMPELAMIVVHPQVLGVLRKQNLTQMVPNSEGTRLIEYYGDLRIVASSTAGLSAGGGVYNTLLVANGAFGYADGTKPEHVLEYDRQISHADTWGSMRRYVIHPYGAKFIGSPAGATASNTELAGDGNWTLGAETVDGFRVRVLKHKIV